MNEIHAHFSNVDTESNSPCPYFMVLLKCFRGKFLP